MKFKQICFTVFFCIFSSALFAQTLKDALDKKDTVTAERLIKDGADINKPDENNTTFLMNSCRWGDDALVHFLLWHGAHPDNPRSPKGRTPLMIACAYYSGKTICGMLIEKGADVNATANDGITALMLAASNAKLDVVQLLLKKGAKPNAKDTNGKTALDYANNAEVSEYLTKSVKDTRLNKQGVTSLLQQAMK